MKSNSYDCIIVGGGIAGLQAAIQLGRYQRNTCVIDDHNGRSTLCRSYKNILGYPEGVSGQYLREKGVQHAQNYGVRFVSAEVTSLEKIGNEFQLTATTRESVESIYRSKTIILATGIGDTLPKIEGIEPCLGLSIYICPDCDGIEIQEKPVAIIGTEKAGVSLAKELLYWTKEITLYLQDGSLSDELQQTCEKLHINVVKQSIASCIHQSGRLEGFIVEGGGHVQAQHAFLAMGNNLVRTSLAAKLGVELENNGHIQTDPRTKMTSIRGIWAAGDIGFHSEQLTIAMGEGTQAAIWVHKYLLHPKVLDKLDMIK